jgi:hypothetical protein
MATPNSHPTPPNGPSMNTPRRRPARHSQGARNSRPLARSASADAPTVGFRPCHVKPGLRFTPGGQVTLCLVCRSSGDRSLDVGGGGDSIGQSSADSVLRRLREILDDLVEGIAVSTTPPMTTANPPKIKGVAGFERAASPWSRWVERCCPTIRHARRSDTRGNRSTMNSTAAPPPRRALLLLSSDYFERLALDTLGATITLAQGFPSLRCERSRRPTRPPSAICVIADHSRPVQADTACTYRPASTLNMESTIWRLHT